MPRLPDRAYALPSLLALTLVALSGCNPWQEREYIDRLVWADDDSELLLLELRFEERQGDALSGSTEKRGFRHQLLRSDLDGGNRLPIGPEREGLAGAELYYMKSAGYLVTASEDEADGALRFERVSLDGETRDIPTPDDQPQFLSVVPSPDGGLLAVVSGRDSEVRVDLLDARSLEAARERATVTLAGGHEWTWRSDGAFVVTDGTSAWALTVGGEGFEDTSVPGCTTPKTTSSEVSSEGVALSTTPEGAIEHSAPDASPAFGCQ